jgi:hypothetical protein
MNSILSYHHIKEPGDRQPVDAPEAEIILSPSRHAQTRRRFVTEINKDEKTVVAKSDVAAKADFNVANVIAAIALLLVVLGGLKYFGASPF